MGIRNVQQMFPTAHALVTGQPFAVPLDFFIPCTLHLLEIFLLFAKFLFLRQNPTTPLTDVTASPHFFVLGHPLSID